jgi:diaminopimelate epimerase
MNGAGNDFVMIDNRSGSFTHEKTRIALLCDRHRGVGADGLIAAELPASVGSHLKMRYFNADGSEAEMCGNGARCFSRFGARLLDLKDEITFETLAGKLTALLLGNFVQLGMSQPHGLALHAQILAADTALEVHSLNTGVPHAVVFCEDLPATNVRTLGAALRHHAHFAPKGTNANFAFVHSPGSLSVRTYERGVEDETLACGTGVVACALLHHLLHGAPSPVNVRVKGGDTLRVAFEYHNNAFHKVSLTGPADFAFEGQIPHSFGTDAP